MKKTLGTLALVQGALASHNSGVAFAAAGVAVQPNNQPYNGYYPNTGYYPGQGGAYPPNYGPNYGGGYPPVYQPGPGPVYPPPPMQYPPQQYPPQQFPPPPMPQDNCMNFYNCDDCTNALSSQGFENRGGLGWNQPQPPPSGCVWSSNRCSRTCTGFDCTSRPSSCPNAKVCCTAFTAECQACGAGLTTSEYCRMYPQTPGCTNAYTCNPYTVNTCPAGWYCISTPGSNQGRCEQGSITPSQTCYTANTCESCTARWVGNQRCMWANGRCDTYCNNVDCARTLDQCYGGTGQMCNPNVWPAQCPTGWECRYTSTGGMAGVSYSCQPVSSGGCTNNVQCPNYQVCVNGRCQQGVSSCVNDWQCAAGEVCRSSKCESVRYCSTANQCYSNEKCVSGICQAGRRCYSQSDCYNGERCEEGYCAERRRCTYSNDCMYQETCVAGFCADGTCSPTRPCPPNYVCNFMTATTGNCKALVTCSAWQFCPLGLTCDYSQSMSSNQGICVEGGSTQRECCQESGILELACPDGGGLTWTNGKCYCQQAQKCSSSMHPCCSDGCPSNGVLNIIDNACWCTEPQACNGAAGYDCCMSNTGGASYCATGQKLNTAGCKCSVLQTQCTVTDNSITKYPWTKCTDTTIAKCDEAWGIAQTTCRKYPTLSCCISPGLATDENRVATYACLQEKRINQYCHDPEPDQRLLCEKYLCCNDKCTNSLANIDTVSGKCYCETKQPLCAARGGNGGGLTGALFVRGSIGG